MFLYNLIASLRLSKNWGLTRIEFNLFVPLLPTFSFLSNIDTHKMYDYFQICLTWYIFFLNINTHEIHDYFQPEKSHHTFGLTFPNVNLAQRPWLRSIGLNPVPWQMVELLAPQRETKVPLMDERDRPYSSGQCSTTTRVPGNKIAACRMQQLQLILWITITGQRRVTAPSCVQLTFDARGVHSSDCYLVRHAWRSSVELAFVNQCNRVCDTNTKEL